MKKQKLQEYRRKSIAELQKNLADEREKLNELQFDIHRGKVKDISQFKKTKENIAQILTIINEKQKNA